MTNNASANETETVNNEVQVTDEQKNQPLGWMGVFRCFIFSLMLLSLVYYFPIQEASRYSAMLTAYFTKATLLFSVTALLTCICFSAKTKNDKDQSIALTLFIAGVIIPILVLGFGKISTERSVPSRDEYLSVIQQPDDTNSFSYLSYLYVDSIILKLEEKDSMEAYYTGKDCETVVFLSQQERVYFNITVNGTSVKTARCDKRFNIIRWTRLEKPIDLRAPPTQIN